MNFSQALDLIKADHRLTRLNWNGPGMFIFLVAGSEFEVNRPPLNQMFMPGTKIKYQSHIDMKTAQGTIVPWVASQSDILADDWIEVKS